MSGGPCRVHGVAPSGKPRGPPMPTPGPGGGPVHLREDAARRGRRVAHGAEPAEEGAL